MYQWPKWNIIDHVEFESVKATWSGSWYFFYAKPARGSEPDEKSLLLLCICWMPSPGITVKWCLKSIQISPLLTILILTQFKWEQLKSLIIIVLFCCDSLPNFHTTMTPELQWKNNNQWSAFLHGWIALLVLKAIKATANCNLLPFFLVFPARDPCGSFPFSMVRFHV